MTDFKVTESGWYRTRDGRDAEVVVSEYKGTHPVIGHIAGEYGGTRSWTLQGLWRPDTDAPVDLIEYLGKERPAQKKVVKMAPALTITTYDKIYAITDWLYSSEEKAREDNEEDFVRWLIDTHSVDVEVPDNG